MARRGGRRERQEATRRAAEERRAAEAQAARGRRRRLIALGAVAALAAVVVGVAIVISSGGSDSTPPPARGREAANRPLVGQARAAAEVKGLVQKANTLGDPLAPYTLVEYGDLVCPACRTYAENILPAVIDRYVRSGRVKIEFRPFGFVRDYSTLAAQYAWAAAEQNKMWQFSALWYANQGDEDTDYVNDEFARKIARGVPGLDVERLIRTAHQPATRKRLDDIARGFVTLGFQVTPAFAAGPSAGPFRPLDLGSSADSAKRAIAGVIAG